MDYEIFDAMPEGGSTGDIKSRKGQSKYPLAKLAVGQMVFMNKSRGVGDSAARVCNKITGFKFRVRKGEYLGVAGTWVERTE